MMSGDREVLALVDRLIEAARDDGWQSDQGSGNEPARAAKELEVAKASLIAYLSPPASAGDGSALDEADEAIAALNAHLKSRSQWIQGFGYGTPRSSVKSDPPVYVIRDIRRAPGSQVIWQGPACSEEDESLFYRQCEIERMRAALTASGFSAAPPPPRSGEDVGDKAEIKRLEVSDEALAWAAENAPVDPGTDPRFTTLAELKTKAITALHARVTALESTLTERDAEIEEMKRAVERLKGTLTYIRNQAALRPSGDAMTLSVIERNAISALDGGLHSMLRAARGGAKS